MEKLKLNFEQLNVAQVLSREQLKKVLGGTNPGGGILCYCDSPILANGQYGTQWIAPGCADQQIASHCGTGTGSCGAC